MVEIEYFVIWVRRGILENELEEIGEEGDRRV